MGKSLGLIGVPSSAGAFAPGQEQAPQALREAGIVEGLAAAGVAVVDYGDAPVWRWRPDPANRYAQNLDVVVETARATAERVRLAVRADQVPLVLGGDCTIELGTVAGHLPNREQIGLLYFDLHPDLNVPGNTGPGALDWMGMAHLLGEVGAAESLSRLGPRFPLLTPERVFLFAYGPEQATPWERERIQRLDLNAIPVEDVAADPEVAAAAALHFLESRCDHLLVHFDVDTVDFTDLPLSENTGRNEGLVFETAIRALRVILMSKRLSAVTVTELNPNHGAEDGSTHRTFVEEFVAALSNAPVLAK